MKMLMILLILLLFNYLSNGQNISENDDISQPPPHTVPRTLPPIDFNRFPEYLRSVLHAHTSNVPDDPQIFITAQQPVVYIPKISTDDHEIQRFKRMKKPVSNKWSAKEQTTATTKSPVVIVIGVNNKLNDLFAKPSFAATFSTQRPFKNYDYNETTTEENGYSRNENLSKLPHETEKVDVNNRTEISTDESTQNIIFINNADVTGDKNEDNRSKDPEDDVGSKNPLTIDDTDNISRQQSHETKEPDARNRTEKPMLEDTNDDDISSYDNSDISSQKDKDNGTKNPENDLAFKDSLTIDVMNNNGEFLSWLSNLTSIYVDGLKELVPKLVEQEVAKQLESVSEKYMTIKPSDIDTVVMKSKDTNNSEGEDKSSNDTRYNNTEEQQNINSYDTHNNEGHSQNKVEAKSVFGNFVGNEHFANIFVFYPNKNDGIDATLPKKNTTKLTKNSYEVINGNGETKNNSVFDLHGINNDLGNATNNKDEFVNMEIKADGTKAMINTKGESIFETTETTLTTIVDNVYNLDKDFENEGDSDNKTNVDTTTASVFTTVEDSQTTSMEFTEHIEGTTEHIEGTTEHIEGTTENIEATSKNIKLEERQSENTETTTPDVNDNTTLVTESNEILRTTEGEIKDNVFINTNTTVQNSNHGVTTEEISRDIQKPTVADYYTKLILKRLKKKRKPLINFRIRF